MRKQETKEFNLKEAFALWKTESKTGKNYLTGHDLNKNSLIGFTTNNFTKKSENQPDVKVYYTKEDGSLDGEACALWINTSKNGKIYLSGYTNDKENIIAFYGDGKNEKAPFIKAYFKED